MNQKPADETQQPHTPDQTAEMLKSFQAAVLAASDPLLHLVSTLHYIYGAAEAGRGEPLKTTLLGYDDRLMEEFEAVLEVFRRRDIPILEEYTDLLPFILETQAGIQSVFKGGDDGAYLRNILRIHGDLSALLNRLLPVQKLIQRPAPKKKAPRKSGRPAGMNAVNRFIGRRARELKTQHLASWSQVIDLLITDLTSRQRTDDEEEVLQKLLDNKLKMSARAAGSYIRRIVERYENL